MSQPIEQSDQRYRRLFEMTRVGIILLDFKTRKITDINPYMVELACFGTQETYTSSKKKMIGKHLSELGIFQHPRITGKTMFDDLKTQSEVMYESVTIDCSNGENRDVEISAHIYQEGKEKIIQCTVRDITKKKEALRELFEANQRLQALMDALPVGVAFSFDAKCEHITGNATLLRQMEILPEMNISASSNPKKKDTVKLRHFINGRVVKASELPMQRAVKENKVIGPLEIEAELPSGRRWTMEAFGAPIRNAEGKVMAAVAVNIDLTERKRAEETSRLERLIDQEKIKISFIADAAHELRTPLAIIKGNLDLATRNMTQKNMHDAFIEDTFKAIDIEVASLSNLLSDLTLLTTKDGEFQKKIDREGTPPTVAVAGLLSHLVHRHRGVARKKNITITFSSIPNAKVTGHEPYIKRLFSNILSNAISYGKEKGSVKITGSLVKNKALRIKIEDNGIGISPEALPHIFDRFYRAENSRSKDFGGTGLGLSIVKWIAEAHGGTVSATSTLNKGSTFTVELPLK